MYLNGANHGTNFHNTLPDSPQCLLFTVQKIQEQKSFSRLHMPSRKSGNHLNGEFQGIHYKGYFG